MTYNHGQAAPQTATALEIIPTPFTNVSIEGQSALVFDVEHDQVLYAKNSSSSYPLASITKVMTALVATERLEKKTLIPITASALATDGESGLQEGEKWELSDLVDFMLVASSNDAAAAIAEYVEADQGQSFVALMNTRAANLGMTKTHFDNPTGLDFEDGRPGARGTSRDIATLFTYVLSKHPSIMEATRRSVINRLSDSNIAHHLNNTNTITAEIPGLLASKTGFTDTAGGNLAIAFDAGLNQPMIVVVLGSSTEGRFHDIIKLVEAAFQSLDAPIERVCGL